MNKQEMTVKAAVEPIIEQMGYELVDVEIRKQNGEPNLTVFIHAPKEGGTDLDDCQRVHLAIDSVLDELEPFSVPYRLNVSSPGLDRVFKTQRDFERNYGKEVEVKFYAAKKIGSDKPKKIIEGVLLKRVEEEQGAFVLIENNGAELRLAASEISGVRPSVRWS